MNNNKHSNQGLIIFFIAIFLIVITRGAIIPFFIIGYIIYKVFFAEIKKNLQNYAEKIKKNTQEIKLKPNQKGVFSSNFTKPKMPEIKIKARHIIISLLIVLATFIVIDGLVSVPAGHVAVIYDRGRGVLDEELPPGLHLKIPFWQTSIVMETRLQEYTMSIAPGEGAYYYADPISSLTEDGQQVDVDATIWYYIDNQKASDIYQDIGLNYEEKVIRPDVRRVIREAVTDYSSKSLYNLETREQLSADIRERLTASYATKNIILDDVLIRNIRFSEVYLDAIEQKQVEQQKIEKAEYERQQAEIIKQKKIIEAEAEAEAIKIRGEALRENPEIIELNFVEKMAPNINWGILPDNTIPLLDLKSIQN